MTVAFETLKQDFRLQAFLQGLAGSLALSGLVWLSVWFLLTPDPVPVWPRFSVPVSAEETASAPTPVETHAPVETTPAPEDAPTEISAEGLSEEGPYGALPIIRKSDGMTSFRAFRQAVSVAPGTSVVAVVVLDVGISESLTTAVRTLLPQETTLAVSPYAADPRALSEAIRKDGREVWLSLPVQAQGFPLNDPGPLALLANERLEVTEDRMKRVLGTVHQPVGAVLSTGLRDVIPQSDLRVWSSILGGRGLALGVGVEDLDQFDPTALDVLPVAMHVRADAGGDEAVTAELARAEEVARKQGKAAVWLHPSPQAVSAVKTWMTEAAVRGVKIVPLSALAKQEEKGAAHGP